MARQRSTIPTYERHSSGKARVRTYDSTGKRIEIILPGDFGSAESKQEYERILTQLRTNGGNLPMHNQTSDMTVAELVQRFMAEHVEHHYRRPDGTSTGEKHNFVMTMRPLVRLFGDKPACEFTPLDLRMVREAMLSGSWMSDEERQIRLRTRGRDGTTCRKETNKRTGRIKHLYKWAVEMMLVPAHVWHGLQAVSGLQAGRGKGRETKPIEPVPLEHVEATIKHMPNVFAAIVRLQLFSGARAGEILLMRTCDIDRAADIWTFTPKTHKNAWRGHHRRLVLGPKAQLALRPYLQIDAPEVFIFKPGMGRPRKQTNLRPHYHVCEYDQAIERACYKADIPKWSSHQLRHLAARLAESEISTEAARAFLGQKTVNLTTHYAGIDLNAAAEVARKIG